MLTLDSISMKISLEISVFPLDKNYSPVIRTFIDRLILQPDIKVIVQPMSTLIIGEYETCFDLLKIELKKVFELDPASISLIKIANFDLTD